MSFRGWGKRLRLLALPFPPEPSLIGKLKLREAKSPTPQCGVGPWPQSTWKGVQDAGFEVGYDVGTLTSLLRDSLLSTLSESSLLVIVSVP